MRNQYMNKTEQCADKLLCAACALTNMDIHKSGFTNMYNAMVQEDKFKDCVTVGDVARALLQYQLDYLNSFA